MKQGYQHPYHTESNPLIFTNLDYLKLLYKAVGPEQVSPHYETLSRSRRGLIFLFLYIGSITSISRLGGWSHNEWIRGMVFHHEYILCFYLAMIETRHFTFIVGPKFTNWYNTYTSYEMAQFFSNWNDVIEEAQQSHLVETKQQMEYLSINDEYDFIKKNALQNYLTSQRHGVEEHMKNRAQSMLTNIEKFEQTNLKKLLGTITTGALEKVNSSLQDPAKRAEIDDQFFQSALAGIRAGVMKYENDPLLPIVTDEIAARSDAFRGLSADEESDLLQLTQDQKQLLVHADRAAKKEFLTSQPAIANNGVKTHEKYQSYVTSISQQ